MPNIDPKTISDTESAESEKNNWHLIVSVAENLYAIHTEYIREIHSLPRIIPLPGNKNQKESVVDFRGEIFPLLDLRRRLGHQSFEQEREQLIDVLKERERDHKKWLDELEKSVVERRAFTLQTDPHKCNFGKWYDNYVTDDLDFWSLLYQFDEPHKTIHSIAEQVTKLVGENQAEEAQKVINLTKDNALKKMIELFSRSYETIRSLDRRLIVILKKDGLKRAAVIDKALSIAEITLDTIQERSLASEKNTYRVAQLQDKVVLLLGAEQLFG